MSSDVVKFATGGYTVLGCVGGPPSDNYELFRKYARLAEEFEISPTAEGNCFIAVQAAMDWPFLVIGHGLSRAWPGEQVSPGVLIVPETQRLFVAVREHLLCYDLAGPRRLWEEDRTYNSFWGWQQHGNLVLMAAELELAAWDVRSVRKWRTFVEPPWDYHVEGDQIHLSVMEVPSFFSLADGPAWENGKWPWIQRP